MNFEEIQDHLCYLQSLDEAEAPMINCYLNVETPYRNRFSDQVRSITGGLPAALRTSFWEILGRIEVFLGTGIQPGTKGVAIFARWGDRPVFLPLQFDAPMPTAITVSPTPQLSPIVELKNAMVCLIDRPWDPGIGRTV